MVRASVGSNRAQKLEARQVSSNLTAYIDDYGRLPDRQRKVRPIWTDHLHR